MAVDAIIWRKRRLEPQVINKPANAPHLAPPVVMVEWFNAHWYKVTQNGNVHWIPSVTTKLGIIDKPFLAKWRGDLRNREADLRMEDAANRGTRIHYAWAAALMNGAVLYNPARNAVYTEEGIAEYRKKYKEVAIIRSQDEMWQIVKLQKQFNILKPKVVDVEKTVFDIEDSIAGTIDHVYYIGEGEYKVNGSKPLYLKEGLYIGDLKTGSVVDENVWLQIAPYLYCYEKMVGITCQGGLVTHTSAKTKAGIEGLATLFRSREELIDKDFPDYLHASKLWMRKHADDKPETFEFPSMITLTNQKDN